MKKYCALECGNGTILVRDPAIIVPHYLLDYEWKDEDRNDIFKFLKNTVIEWCNDTIGPWDFSNDYHDIITEFTIHGPNGYSDRVPVIVFANDGDMIAFRLRWEN